VFGEGVLHLARPFLLAGVSAVVATLWDVDDAGASTTLIEFPRRLSAGATRRAHFGKRNTRDAPFREFVRPRSAFLGTVRSNRSRDNRCTYPCCPEQEARQ